MSIVCEENFWCNSNVWSSYISGKYPAARSNGRRSLENEPKVKMPCNKSKLFVGQKTYTERKIKWRSRFYGINKIVHSLILSLFYLQLEMQVVFENDGTHSSFSLFIVICRHDEKTRENRGNPRFARLV